MRKTLIAVILFATPIFAQTPKGPEQAERERRFRESISRGVVYRVPGMDKVELRNEVAYKKAGEQRLFADFYIPRPRAKDAKFPAVVFIHGGIPDDTPIKPKEWGHFRSWGELAAASGLVGVTFNHRLGTPPEARLGEAASDLAELLTLLREESEYFHVDKNKVCLVSFSGGGPLLTAALRERPPYVRCLVSYYNILEISGTDFSPLAQVAVEKASIPPMFIARAGKDEIPGINESIDRFVEAALVGNAPITVMVHPTGPHGFDTRTNDARSREIIKATIDFLKWHLK